MDNATYFPLICKRDTGVDLAYVEWRLSVLGDDKLIFLTYDGASAVYEYVKSDDTLTSYQNEWIHIAATADASGEEKTMKLYINGAEISSTRADAGSYTAMHDTAAKAFIGYENLGSPSVADHQYANGTIDEVSVWGVELTAVEVLELYHGGDFFSSTRSPPAPGDLTKHSQYTNLVSWWRLGDSGDTVSTGVIATSIDRKGSNNAAGQNSPTIGDGPGPSYGDTILTASLYDNAFVSHMIPRTDQQTRWITGSLI
jgi:hypothetical protein